MMPPARYAVHTRLASGRRLAPGDLALDSTVNHMINKLPSPKAHLVTAPTPKIQHAHSRLRFPIVVDDREDGTNLEVPTMEIQQTPSLSLHETESAPLDPSNESGAYTAGQFTSFTSSLPAWDRPASLVVSVPTSPPSKSYHLDSTSDADEKVLYPKATFVPILKNAHHFSSTVPASAEGERNSANEKKHTGPPCGACYVVHLDEPVV